ncbi:MAG: polysaccharide deacetylase [Lachnospiraceae bacterium]|nr:polysaccharide deacetylase [Lachnospiraceae bacterium]
MIVVLIIVLVVIFGSRGQVRREERQEAKALAEQNAGEVLLTDEEVEPEIESEPESVESAETVIAEADRLAAMYDYDAAIAYLQDSSYYNESAEMQSAVTRYEETKDACVAWAPEDVTHVFYHTLIVDPSKAFDGDYKEADYNQYYCTVDECNKITQSMYDKGYVMVSMHDMVDISEDGTITPKDIMLPEGKIPFVLSQDDVSYYHYMDGDGFAEKLIIDENGQVKNTYIEDDGTVSIGDYDLVPLIDTFVEEHPDFSYHGHKGTVALTGYDGVLGYRTDEVYLTKEESRISADQQAFFDANPDFDEAAWQQEVDDATAVADAMKEEGWEFASHTWGHIDPLAVGYESFKTDTDRWVDYVEPITGYTDIIIFAFGADITNDIGAYSDDNEYFQYLKEKGFNIYCNVDSSADTVVVADNCMRMGRRNIDGYRMYYNPDMLSDLFTVDEVWDPARPSTVEPIE